MFGRSEIKGHPVRNSISKRRGAVQIQQSDEHHFFKCPLCSFRTPLRGDLQKHISMYHKQVFVCKICTSKFSSREDLVEHKRLSHLNIPLESEQGRVYSCQKCGSKFANAKIFAVHVKITCLKGDFVGPSGKKNKYRLYNPSNMVQKTTDGKISQMLKKEEKFSDSLPFHQLPQSQPKGFFDTSLETQTRPVITHVQVKKCLLRSLGNAKQCKLCDKMFSREKAAVDHVFESHDYLLGPSNDNLERKGRQILSAFFGHQALNLESSTPPIKTENTFGDIED